MYLKDGIIYGEETVPSLRVSAIKVLPDHILLITFNTGETRLFDAEVLSGPVYMGLKDPAVFSNPVIDHGVLTWKNGEIDCAPEYLYDHSYEYSNTMVV